MLPSLHTNILNVRKQYMPRRKSAETETEQPRTVRTRTVRRTAARSLGQDDAIAMPPVSGMTAEELSEEVREIQMEGCTEPEAVMMPEEPDVQEEAAEEP